MAKAKQTAEDLAAEVEVAEVEVSEVVEEVLEEAPIALNGLKDEAPQVGHPTRAYRQ